MPKPHEEPPPQPKPLEFDGPIEPIGSNRHGWLFCVGQLGGRWVGMAVSRGREGPGFIHLFGEIAEGYRMGITDRDTAVRMTGALAQDPDQMFGGIDHWFVPPELRGHPENLPRCGLCQRPCCQGECVDEF